MIPRVVSVVLPDFIQAGNQSVLLDFNAAVTGLTLGAFLYSGVDPGTVALFVSESLTDPSAPRNAPYTDATVVGRYFRLEFTFPDPPIPGTLNIALKANQVYVAPPQRTGTGDTPLPVWSGFTLSGTQAIVLSDTENKLYIFDYPDTADRDFGIGVGAWKSIAADSSKIYLLDAVLTAPKIKTLPIPIPAGDPLTPADFLSLDAGSETQRNAWLAITVANDKLYAIGKIANDTVSPNPDFKVYVYDISGASPARVSSEDKNLALNANYTAMAIHGNFLNMLIADAGVRIRLDLTSVTQNLGADADTSAILIGSTGWVGLDYSSVTGRTGFYALQENGARIIAFTDGDRRNTDHDYRFR